jgi:hypothetical protein
VSGRAAKAERRARQVAAEAAQVAGVGLRVAQRWATYRGNHVESLGHVLGPNTLGEGMVVVDCDYDPEADKSRLGFAFAGNWDALVRRQRFAR